ncbi:hypothetical protein BHE74_00059350 [Ensete ventricosum]|nr:hypothetical protein GW17_00052634 [Ensete ventricosum]RWW35687.1 hypothetical protein BHE74_00059350 [Ensete ventricosum]RZS07105.1 hypothetical protein BHM03_00037882 [Ensete ventricosum]
MHPLRFPNRKVWPQPIGVRDLVLRKAKFNDPGHSRVKLAPEMGRFVSCRPSYPRRDLHSSDNGWEDPLSDLACIKLENVLCLNVRLKTRRALTQYR